MNRWRKRGMGRFTQLCAAAMICLSVMMLLYVAGAYMQGKEAQAPMEPYTQEEEEKSPAQPQAQGEEGESAARPYAPEEAIGPLIQTTTLQDEYEGLVHLGLLRTQENYNGDMAQSIRDVMPAVVQIQTGRFLGSGVILEIREDTLLIVSNRHQLQSQDFSLIRLYHGAEVSAKRIYLSDVYDLGFALADISGLPYEERELLRSVSMREDCEEGLRRGTEMFLIGSADGVACNIYEGTVVDPWYYFEEFGSYMIYNYCKAKAGMSGGGTFDEHGHCIGMITGGFEQETASLPMKCIREEWEKVE